MVNLITEHIDIWTAIQTQKTNGGRGRGKNSNGQSSYGIKKLRELILELAVRGKLVPQDPEDEPASVLLEKIAREKARLIKEGKIKKHKKLPEIGEDEKPFELPERWEWVRLGSISQINPRNEAEDNLATSFIPMPLISTSHTGEHGQEIKKWGEIKKGYTHFMDGDIGVAKITPCFENSKAVVLSGLENGIGAGTTELHIARPFGSTLAPRYILLFLKAPMFLHVGKTKMTGTAGQKRVAKVFFSETPLPFPPLAEQHRIVAKVDELMDLCDQLEQQQTDSNSTHQTLLETLLATLTSAADQDKFTEAWQRIAKHFDTLFTTEQSIEQLKQTILQIAVMGKLVPQEPTDLPAPESGKFFVYALECEDKSIYVGQTGDILKRWQEHAAGKGAEWTKKHPPIRLVHWEEYDSREEAIKREKELKTGFGRKWIKRELAAGRTRQAGEPASVLLEKIAKEKAQLIKEGKIKKQKPLPEISEDEKPFDLPEGWEFVRLGNIVNRIGSGSTPRGGKSAYVESGTPFLRSQNVWNHGLELNDVAYISEETHQKMSNTVVMPNDILLNITGASLGRCAVYPDGLAEANVSQHVTIIRPTDSATRFYLHLCILSPYTQELVWGRQVGMAREGLSKKVLELFEIPCPPLAEQHRIVAKVNELMELCDMLKARLNDAQATQVHLAEAIVEQAAA